MQNAGFSVFESDTLLCTVFSYPSTLYHFTTMCCTRTSQAATLYANTEEFRMKFGIIIETKEFEKAWNAFRFALTAKRVGHQVKVFLMGEGVECEGLTHEKYNVDVQLKGLLSEGGEILACGTCLKSRNLSGSEACPISTMNDCVEMATWADRVVTF
jgi:uncharacterized protein involved in oxidation of intracellular sulfur